MGPLGTPETVAPPVTPPVQPQTPPVDSPPATPPADQPDLIQKVAQFKPKSDPAAAAGTFKEFDVIQDPVAREAAINKYKEAQSFGTKAQQRAKDLERQLQEVNNWSPERIQQLLNNPQFVQAAQQVAGTASTNPKGQSDDDYSALSDTEKAKLNALESQVKEFKQAQFQATISQTDAQLRAKYGDAYNPQEIDEALSRLAQMQPHEIREYVWKSIKHDENVTRSYKLREEELKQLNQEKINSISSNGTNAVNNDGIPQKEKGESDLSFIARIGRFRLEQSRKK